MRVYAYPVIAAIAIVCAVWGGVSWVMWRRHVVEQGEEVIAVLRDILKELRKGRDD